jgi:virginiamycin A acetyltransferase
MSTPRGARWVVDAICGLLTLMPVLMCRAERRAFGGTRLYVFFTQWFAILPGAPGVFLRAGFYRGTLQRFGQRVYVGFGALVSRPDAVIEDDAYIGPYAVIGFTRLGARTLVGTRASLLSGGGQHRRTGDGRWTPFDGSPLERVDIAEDVWIGEGAIVMADVGRGAMIAAGSVVSSPVAPDVVVAGNPSRFVRKFEASSGATEGQHAVV